MFKQLLQIGKWKFFVLKWQDRSHEQLYSHSPMTPKATYSPWQDNQEFLETYESTRHHTLVDIYRCYELWECVEQLNKVKGDILEVGVWKGGTAAIINKANNSHSHMYLCDTFEGVVKASELDPIYKGGEHSDTSLALVQSRMESLNCRNYSILKGIFPDETSNQIPESTRFKFCHIDVDVYKSALDIYNWIYPRLVPGGVVIFDDYGFASCEGITTLVNEISQDENILKLHNLNGHGLIIKIQ